MRLANSEEGVGGPPDLLQAAQALARRLAGDRTLPSGEPVLESAAAVAQILQDFDEGFALQAASYLVTTVEGLDHPSQVLTQRFGASLAQLALETRELIAVQERARALAEQRKNQNKTQDKKRDVGKAQLENVRKMLLAFGRDLRVVLLRLAMHLQTLRYYARVKTPPPEGFAHEGLMVFAPLANRLGLGSLKWEIEDLSFRFLEPAVYKAIADKLEDKRSDRMRDVAALKQRLFEALQAQGLAAKVDARPKHIYSIAKKMRGKNLPFERVFDVRAMRVLVPSVDDCYAALDLIHTLFEPIVQEYDDYIAHPKSNGYQSLHTVVREGVHGKPIEIQIRTHAMHERAESGVAAHWAYKEAGAKGYAGVVASSDYDRKIAVLRNLLAWQQEVSGATGDLSTDILQDRIYVLTPEARIIDLPRGATPVDFAYALHTSLGDRCRGATVDGTLVPLHTALQSGQTVSITAAKEGGPSRDWLNPELGLLVSARAKTKVRAWFNAQAREQTIVRGRESVEKCLQREGKTALKLEDIAAQLGFPHAEDLFEAVGKDELSLKTIEGLWMPKSTPLAEADTQVLQNVQARRSKSGQTLGRNNAARSGVWVAGVDAVLTQLARCCKPAPPDEIGGFVTRGKGVSIHRIGCANFVQLRQTAGDRLIEVAWRGEPVGDAALASPLPGRLPSRLASGSSDVFAVDLSVQATPREGLLRDLSEVLAKEKLPILAVQRQERPVKSSSSSSLPLAWMTFTVGVRHTSQLKGAMAALKGIAGVVACRRQ